MFSCYSKIFLQEQIHFVGYEEAYEYGKYKTLVFNTSRYKSVRYIPITQEKVDTLQFSATLCAFYPNNRLFLFIFTKIHKFLFVLKSLDFL